MTHDARNHADAFERLRQAVEARDAFLKEHPELQPLQDEITRLMRQMGSPHNRMALLDSMLRERVLELQRKMVELREVLIARLAAIQAEEALGEPAPVEESTAPREPGQILGPADDWPVPGDDAPGET